ncbi:hypothetical protein [Saccharothrix obliqua]|uniref:hypothetical protein n=1 Tax=Saccharothrix obliqua TaxID=2861747 RepID=UPI001C606CE9|nr:hypothetical protein [Saccharothrix obliqua]MBW4722409.1 hypothetical protein [Saccharothrix obliqua]
MSLFTGPFVLIDPDNRAVGTAGGRALRDLFDALAALRNSRLAVALVGTLRSEFAGVDVDLRPDAEPVAGQAAMDRLVAWCVDHDAPYLVRESGRPGNGHLIVHLGRDQAKRRALRLLCRELERAFPLTAEPRRPLRVLSTGHRHGLPDRVLGGTLTAATAAALLADVDEHQDHSQEHVDRPRRRSRAGSSRPRRTAPDQQRQATRSAAATQTRTPVQPAEDVEFVEPAPDDTPSGEAFGIACAMLRAGFTPAEVWAATETSGVAERGERDWRDYLLFAAYTKVAAEKALKTGRDLDGTAAWTWLTRECPGRTAKDTGEWVARTWPLALAEARSERRRRYRLPGTAQALRPSHLDSVQHELVREAVHQAAAADPELAARRPQARRSLAALIDTVVEAIATTAGRISRRRMAVESRLSTTTVQARLADAIASGLVRVVASHKLDGQDCDVFTLGPAAQRVLNRLREQAAGETWHRSCTPPRPRTHGHSDPSRLAARHTLERTRWPSPAPTSAHSEGIKATYPEAPREVAAVASSRLRQRAWWAALAPGEQEQRRQVCRDRLEAMSPDDVDTWRAWLARRDELDATIDRLVDGTGDNDDLTTVANAPMTVHHGRQDPLWRVGGTPARTRHAKSSAGRSGRPPRATAPSGR